MVRRRSTVRFRKGAPGKKPVSKSSEQPVGPTVGPTGSDYGTVPGQQRLTPGSLCPPESRDVQKSLGDLGLIRIQDRDQLPARGFQDMES